MKTKILFIANLLFTTSLIFGQKEYPDSTKTINLEEVTITANRLPILLKSNIGAVSLVTSENLSAMPKAIGAEEALRLVPGIRIDNQHDGERVHVSIRGQGILTERGLRGIEVLIDGIPVNDPSGFAPDLYDVDWSTVKKIEVLRGPAAGLYGGGGAAGILNLSQFDNLKQANPDARPFNEYQKTNRTTLGFLETYKFSTMQDLQVSSFLRLWNYKETSNKCAEYRNYTVPGVSVQYNLHSGSGRMKNHVSIGSDVKWQNIDIYKLQSAGDPNRVESIDETNLETDSLLANQIISQNSYGFFALYRLEFSKLNFMGNLRYDIMNNELTNKMLGPDTAKTSKNFIKASLRLGASYAVSKALTFYLNWSQGFMPPSTEELASNPVGYSGFNTHLVPATSGCSEIGIRGFYYDWLNFELTAFTMNTKNDFFRFKQTGRGNQEVFYGNAGNSRRNGIETFVSLKIAQKINLQVAYTYADYKYISATVDPVYTNTEYVLTTPPAKGQWLPNSPKHQIYSELGYTIGKSFKISLGTEYQSKSVYMPEI